MSLALLGLLTIVSVLAAIMSRRVTPLVALIALPTLAALLAGFGLLTGALPEDCAKCPARATTTTRALAKKVARLAREDEVAPDFAQRAGIRRAQQRLRELRGEEQALRGDAPERADREPRLRALAAAVAACEAELTYAVRKPRRAWLRRRLHRLLRIGRSAAADRTASAAAPPAP